MSNKDYYPPMRPPRAMKVSKDTSLINIIAELSVSKSNEDRKRKKTQLEKDYKASDAKLAQLISDQKEDLAKVMETFSKVSSIIAVNKLRCKSVLEKLTNCKKLLQCKRDELRRLWFEAVEHKEVLTMLQEIEDLKKVTEKVQKHLKDGCFLQATEVLVSSISLLEENLSAVDALKDMKVELYTLREILHSVLVEELHKFLYMSPAGAFLKRNINEEKQQTYEEIFGNRRSPVSCKLPIVDEQHDDNKDPNHDHIAVILECLLLLNALPETVEILKEKCQRELMSIVKNSCQLMYDTLENSSYPSNNQKFSGSQNASVEQQRFLLDLLQAILEQFRFVAINYHRFLNNLQKVATSKGLTNLSCYEMADVYCKIQAAVELFVADYLDLYKTASSQERTAATFTKVPTVSDISSFFLRKNPVRQKKHALFKFDGSSHAINMKSYLQEQKDTLKEKGELDSIDADHHSILICQPSAKNITIIYKSLKKFVTEIEVALHMDSSTHCSLHTFLIDAVKVFLDEVNIEVTRLIGKTSNSLEIWKPVAPDPEDLRGTDVKTQILNSTLTLNFSLRELQNLISSLPDFSNHFIQLIYNVLQTYKDLCNSAYKELIYSDNEEQRVFSVSWARDNDISRLLRSLPNWTNLQIEENTEYHTKNDFEESPEEIRFRNKEESELLIRNLSCKDCISQCEILSNPTQLHNLALMHESMEWFSSEIKSFISSLPDIHSSVTSLIVPEKEEGETIPDFSIAGNTIECLKKLAKDYEDLSDTCLLVLHLEVRAHCFYFLLPLSKQESYVNRKDDQEPEPEVLKLNADLSKIDEALAPILQPKKIKYVFEGLGELLSTILINSVSNIKKINENGVKKMGRNIFAIQQNLAGITMTREVALDRARQYFDLLNHSFEDILNQIVEEGPQFQEHEYSAIFHLLYNSKEMASTLDNLTVYLEKLRQILDEVAVSV